MRSRNTSFARTFNEMPVAITGVIRAEVLRGAMNDIHRQKLLHVLDSVLQIPVDEKVWDLLGDHLAEFRKKGVTVPFQDALIATIAVANNLILWTIDEHFKLISEQVPNLKLYRPE